jgi:hypothetical protein
MTNCVMCQKPAEKHFAWVNTGGSGVGASTQGGNMCFACMSLTWDALSRFPNAREAVTISPIKKEREAA